MLNKHLESKKLSQILFICIALIYSLIYMTKNCYSAAMVLLVEDGILTKSQTGIITSVFYLVYAPFQIMGGFAADKYSPSRLITIGLLGATVTNALIPYTNSYYVMLFIWALNGAVQFGVWPAIFKIASSCLEPSHRENAVFLLAFASTLGLVLSYLLAGTVSGWKSNFSVSAIMLLILSVIWVFAARYFDSKMINDKITCKNARQKNEPASRANKSFLFLTLKSGLILILPTIVLTSLFSLGVQAITPSMIRECYPEISASLASILTIIPIVSGVVGKFSIRFLYAKKVYNECITMVVILFILIPVISLILLIGKISAWSVLTLISFVVLLSTGASLITISYIPIRFIKLGRTGTVSGLINAMSAFGIVISNFTSPYIADNYGWRSVIISWIIFAIIALFFSIVAYFPWKKFIR